MDFKPTSIRLCVSAKMDSMLTNLMNASPVATTVSLVSPTPQTAKPAEEIGKQIPKNKQTN
jgi:hypothetical protein